jgi:hypothetical protein
MSARVSVHQADGGDDPDQMVEYLVHRRVDGAKIPTSVAPADPVRAKKSLRLLSIRPFPDNG